MLIQKRESILKTLGKCKMPIFYITETDKTSYEIEASSEEDALKKFEDSYDMKPSNFERIDFSIKEVGAKDNWVYVCIDCKGTEVYTDIWQNLNDDSDLSEGAGEKYCQDCASSCKTEYILEEE